MFKLLFFAAALLSSIGCQAASVQTTVSNGVNVITLSGRIIKDDDAQFARVAVDPSRPTAVFLDSLGGSVAAALGIGEQIRAKQWSTAVSADRICASACALIWLAGNSRYASATARIGFHAAYNGNPDAASASGVGNAMIGAYLTRLGMSYQVVTFVTSAPPDQLRWLGPQDAARLGIAFSALPRDWHVSGAGGPATATVEANPLPADPHMIPIEGAPATTWDSAQRQCRKEAILGSAPLIEAFEACMRRQWLSGTRQ